MSSERAVLAIAIADIAIGERVGFYHKDHARNLAESMRADGQHDPIHVRRNGNAAKQKWTLVAGRHRIGAAGYLGWTHIDAIQVADAQAKSNQLLRLELSENLDHRNPRPLERAIFIEMRARLEEATVHPGRAGEAAHDRAIRVRWTKANASKADTSAIVADVSDWRSRVAATVGCSLRTLERYRQLYSAIIEPFFPIGEDRITVHPYAEALNAHPLGESLNAMSRIAQIKAIEGRRAVIQAIIADPALATIDAALVAAKVGASKGSRARPAAAPYNSFISAFRRMPAPERKAVAIEFAEDVPPEIAKGMMAAFIKRGISA